MVSIAAAEIASAASEAAIAQAGEDAFTTAAANAEANNVPATTGQLNESASQIAELKSSVLQLQSIVAAQTATISAVQQANGIFPTQEVPVKEFFNIREGDIVQRIEAGFPVIPPAGALLAPHLYDLHGDRTYGLLKDGNRKSECEEYRLLVCISLYLSVANKAIEETIGEGLTPENSDTAILRPIINTYQEVESWFRKRIAFIRAKAASTNQDGQYIEYLRSHIYGQGDSAELGSAAIKKLEILFTAETQRAVRNQAAKEEGKKLLAKGKEPRGGADGGRGAFNRDKKTIAKPIRKAD